MRVLHISSVHPPFDTRIFHKECVSLARAGNDVTLLVAGDVNEERAGVEVRSVAPSRSRFDRLTLLQWRLLRAALRSDAEVVHVHDPDLIPLGLILAARGRRVVYDAHEDFASQLAVRTWIPRPLRRPVPATVGALERLASRAFAQVVVATPAIAERFPPDRTTIVQNFPASSEYPDPTTATPYGEREAVVFYVGSITRARGAVAMVDAIAELPEDLDVRFVLAGRINEPGLLEEMQRSPGWNRTDYLGVIDRIEVQVQLDRSRVGLVVLQPIGQYPESQPVKLFEYLGAGVPVVASDFALWRPFVGDIDAGVHVDSTSPESIAAGIAELLADPDRAAERGHRGRAAVWDRWNWDSEAEALLAAYERIAS